MKYELAKSTGFTMVQHTQDNFSEVLHKVLPNPVEDASRSGFALSDRKDRRIKDLIKKASVAYTVDGMVRQVVDKYSELFKTFSLQGGDAQVAYLKTRLVRLTLQTGEHWETLLIRLVHEYFKTGNAFLVKKRGENSAGAMRGLYRNKPYAISGLYLVSADRLDVTRNKDGDLLGWAITGTKDDTNLRLFSSSPGAKQNPDQALISITTYDASQKNVLTPGMDVVQIAYKKGVDSNFGFGIVLAGLEDISMTRTLEQITAIMMKKFSNPIIHHKILRPSSPLAGMQQEINMAYDLYRRMAPDGVLITGGNAEVKAIGSESQALRVEGYLKYFLHRAIASLGMSPHLLGLENGGQGTLEASIELMMMKVRFCQAELARELEMFLINELLWEGGYDPFNNETDQVKLIFEDIDENSKIKLQTHVADMFQKNMLGHDEARTMGRIKGAVKENDLYLNKIDIPKTKAEADAKGVAQKDAGVAIVKARPKPAAAKRVKNSKEVLEDIEGILPENIQQLNFFINFLEKKFGYSAEALKDLYTPLSHLLGDKEAVQLLIVERLSDV